MRLIKTQEPPHQHPPQPPKKGRRGSRVTVFALSVRRAA